MKFGFENVAVCGAAKGKQKMSWELYQYQDGQAFERTKLLPWVPKPTGHERRLGLWLTRCPDCGEAVEFLHSPQTNDFNPVRKFCNEHRKERPRVLHKGGGLGARYW